MLLGCGGGNASNSSVILAQDEAEPNDVGDFPHDVHIGELAVTEDAGWVSGSRSDETAAALWRVTTEGTTEIAEFPDIHGLSINGGGNRLAAAAIRCSSHTANDCDQWAADLLQFSEDGVLLTESTIFESELPLQRSDGVPLIGASSQTVWAHAPNGIVAVGREGDVLEQIPWEQGHMCVFGNDLYLLETVTHGDQTLGDPPVASQEADPSPSSLTYVVNLWDQNRWKPVSDDHLIEVDNSLRVSCGTQGFIIDQAGVDQLPELWNLDQGWSSVSEDVITTVPDLEDAIGPMHSADQYAAQLDDGRIFVRTADGAYVDFGLMLPLLDLLDVDSMGGDDLEVPEGSLTPSARVQVAASDRMALGCVSGHDNAQHRSACSLSVRD